MRRTAALIVLAASLAGFTSVASAAAAVKKDWNYPSSAVSSGGTPTGEKPESKLWVAGGAWWGLMVSPGGQYQFYRLENNSWVSKGAGGDDRVFTKPDTLFSGNKLYVASRDNSGSKQNRFYRYGFNATTNTFTKELGPVTVPGGGAETLTIARDSVNRLWLAYEKGNAVKVAYSTNDGQSWSEFTLGVSGAKNLNSDDIAAVVSFGGKVGVMWSNQEAQKFYFAYHADSSTPTSGWTGQTAYSGSSVADDHVNLKALADGTVLAAVKTSLKGSSDPLVVLLKRSPSGTWTRSTVFTGSTKATRPIVVMTGSTVSVVATLGDATLRYKSASAANPSFSSGSGTVLMSASGGEINDATSAKTTENPAPGSVVLATQAATRSYYHAAI